MRMSSNKELPQVTAGKSGLHIIRQGPVVVQRLNSKSSLGINGNFTEPRSQFMVPYLEPMNLKFQFALPNIKTHRAIPTSPDWSTRSPSH
jgi:hypothetical protein